MSENSEESKVKVLNEEYERVLSNPENVIISDDLQELLDIPMSEDNSRDIDTMTVSILGEDKLPVSVRGEFVRLSRSENGYSLTLKTQNVKSTFLKFLDNLTESPGLLTVQGEYSLEVTDCRLLSWSVDNNDRADFSFSIYFRSEDGIF